MIWILLKVKLSLTISGSDVSKKQEEKYALAEKGYYGYRKTFTSGGLADVGILKGKLTSF